MGWGYPCGTGENEVGRVSASWCVAAPAPARACRPRACARGRPPEPPARCPPPRPRPPGPLGLGDLLLPLPLGGLLALGSGRLLGPNTLGGLGRRSLTLGTSLWGWCHSPRSERPEPHGLALAHEAAPRQLIAGLLVHRRCVQGRAHAFPQR